MQHGSSIGQQNVVPQILVVTIIIALVHYKPVLLNSSAQLRQIESQIERISDAITPQFDPAFCVVNCSPDLPWSVLGPRFARCVHSVLILKRVDRLSMETQMQLGYALMQQSNDLRSFFETSALIFTSKTSSDKLHPFLRRQIIVNQRIDLAEENLVMVELTSDDSAAAARETENQVREIRDTMSTITIAPELLRYIQDILMFIRTHRLTRVGVRPQAASDFELLVRTLCVLEGRPFATPQIIRDAARLVLPVHVSMCTAEDEPSLQYGGDFSTVKAWIKEWDSELIVDSVLEKVPAPR